MHVDGSSDDINVSKDIKEWIDKRRFKLRALFWGITIFRTNLFLFLLQFDHHVDQLSNLFLLLNVVFKLLRNLIRQLCDL